MGRVDELRALLPRGLASEPGAKRFWRGVLVPVAQFEAWADVKLQRTALLLDPAEVPDELVPFLASLVGVGADLSAAFSLSPDQQRALISVAVALWKRKGTRRSLRDVVLFLTGARTYHLDWFYFRLVQGSALELHLLPAPSTSLGTRYDNPETVTDVWLLDVTGMGVDVGIVERWLEVLMPTNERINLRRALFIEDLQLDAVLWDLEVAGGADGFRDDLGTLLTNGTTEGLLSSDGNNFVVAAALPIPADPDAGMRHFVLLAVHGSAELLVFSADPLGDDCYQITIDNDDGSGLNAAVTVRKVVAGVPGPALVTWVLPQVLVDGFSYRWTLDAFRHEGTGDTEIRVRWEGLELGAVLDTTAPLTDGRFGFRAGTAPDLAIVQAVLLWRPVPTMVRVGLDP